jgi:hypothetical protein
MDLNLTKPFIDWTNAQVETFTRFARSPEIAEWTRSSVDDFWRVVQENQSRIIQSDAFAEWTNANIENFRRFAEEYSRALFAVASQAQAEFTRGIQEGTSRLQQVARTASNIAGAAADEVSQAVNASAEEVAEETEDLAKARGGRRHS